MTFTTTLQFGDRVHIDGDTSIVGIVTGFSFRPDGYHQIEVSWMHSGSAQSSWFNEFRIKASKRSVAIDFTNLSPSSCANA